MLRKSLQLAVILTLESLSSASQAPFPQTPSTPAFVSPSALRIRSGISNQNNVQACKLHSSPPAARSLAAGRRRTLVRCVGRAVEESVSQEEARSVSSTGVKVIFSDVDGTLLNSKHRLDPATIAAVRDAVSAGITFVMATGKARGGWVKELRHDLGLTDEGFTVNGPGVFIQGLLVCDAGGTPVLQLLLPNEAVRQINQFAATHDLTVIAYTTGDSIACAQTNSLTDVLYVYNEPVPQSIGREGMDQLGSGSGHPDVYKMILLAEEEKLARLRATLERDIAGKMALTKAMDGMLELLPLGSSKATGVAHAMELLGVEPSDCMAMGDGENDLEFLQMVKAGGGVAVAMRNGVPSTKAAASHVVASNDEGGAAEAIRRFALGEGSS